MNMNETDIFQDGERFRGYVVERLLGKGVTKTVFSNGETLVCDYDQLSWRLEKK